VTRYSEPFLLSAHGSTRATAYQFGNKSVTVGDKTHVVWLDAVAKVCGRTYDHAAGSWGETVHLFDGSDNHTNPALAVDAHGRLHLAYGPHGWWGDWNYGRFRYAVGKEPNSLESLADSGSFGYNATYACLVTTPLGLDCVVYRGGEEPPALMFQRQRPLGGWTNARPLLCQEIAPQYTHLGAQITCAADGTLYAAGHFYNTAEGRSLGVGVVKSADMGETWTVMAGQPLTTPAPLGPRVWAPSPVGCPYLMGLATDSSRRLWLATYDPENGTPSALLSRWTGTDWQTVDLTRTVPEPYNIVYGAFTVDAADRLHLAVAALDGGAVSDAEEGWGHPSLEVFHLCSADGGATFECNQVSAPDAGVANWFPAISLPSVFHPVRDPVILYTRGIPGEGCSPTTETEVWCVMVEGVG
jgi:hypothetical protein